MKKVGDMDAKCTAENRDPIASEVSLKTEILDTVEELRKIVETQERQERVFGELAKPANLPETRQKSTEGRPEGGEKRDQFRSLGEQMAAVVRAGKDHQIDPRLYTVRAASGLNETIPSEGGLI
jgi:hypothetical protein